MKRALGLVLLAASMGLAVTPRAEAQTAVRFGVVGDTAFTAVPGAPTTVIVSATNATSDYSGCSFYPFYSGYCISHARLTFVFDPAQIDIIAAEPINSGLSTLSGASQGTGLFTVTASGLAVGYEAQLFRLRVRLAPGVTDGAYLWLRVDSLRTPNYILGGGGVGARSAIGQVCHATQMWGDVDANSRVDSRDALITLTAAVGLPVTGFPGLATLGDVDGDHLVNSRDALMMLSYAVDVPTETTSRVGNGIADACPGPSAPGETVVFKRNSATGSGLYRLDATATTPALLSGSNSLDDFPRLNAGGTDVVFQCDSMGTRQLCRSSLDGVARRYLDPTVDWQSMVPDWSPGGGKIVFRQNGYVALMDSSGANRVFAAGVGPNYGANGAAWSRNGTLLAYSNMSNGIKTIRLSDSALTLLTSEVNDGDQVRWSPDGASVLFSRIIQPYTIWSVSATPGGTPQRLVAFQGGSSGFDVGPQGILFTATGPAGGNAVWLLKGGPNGPIVRITSPPSGLGDMNPSFRRNP